MYAANDEETPGTPVPPRPPGSVGAFADLVADSLRDLLFGASVTITSGAHQHGETDIAAGYAMATGPGAADAPTIVGVQVEPRVARLLQEGPTALGELLAELPSAALRTLRTLGGSVGAGTTPSPALRRAVRDTMATEILTSFFTSRLGVAPVDDLLGETIDYLIELSGTRVEAKDLTHGVILTDLLTGTPRLELRYPHDLRSVKRAPLLFDGRQSVLLVDPRGRARTELQRHRFDRLGGDSSPASAGSSWLDSGSLVVLATRSIGGIGFFVRADRGIWTFVDGQPLLVRRGEHWTAFPVELAGAISNLIGGGPAATIVARAATMISSRPQGAILAIVDDPTSLDYDVPSKDRYDLRDVIDPAAMRPETRLHHLIDTDELDEHTVARLAALDGATVLDRQGRLIAYGAIVTTVDSEHEGARTAAARTLSHHAMVVLKVSVDGDITIFRDGKIVTTLLGHPPHTARNSQTAQSLP